MVEDGAAEVALGGGRRERVQDAFRRWQDRLVETFGALDEGASFKEHAWDRAGGGGGRARVIEEGATFERGGVNWSAVHGDAVPASLAQQHPGTEGRPFFATGVSMVLHPRHPHAPSFHANYRYFEVGHGEASGVWWFGGGADLTPYRPVPEDPIEFHRALRAQCERHPDVADYEALKARCDDYFTIRHRGEMRGVGGIFFDRLESRDFEAELAFVLDGFATIQRTYPPLLERHADAPASERAREWQLLRRGRYVEFNLVYDRGTLFGLQTNGNIEAILMSMPLRAHWRFDHQPAPGSEEAALLPYLQPRPWASWTPSDAKRTLAAEAAAEPDAP